MGLFFEGAEDGASVRDNRRFHGNVITISASVVGHGGRQQPRIPPAIRDRSPRFWRGSSQQDRPGRAVARFQIDIVHPHEFGER